LLSALFSNNEHLFYRYADAPIERTDLKGLIGIMVDFKEDDNPLTSGNGKFIQELDIGFIEDNDILRCSKQILDPPPHDINYFLSQLKAVKNYYHTISNGLIDLEIDMIENPLSNNSVYTIIDSEGEEQEMEFFAYSENDITELYKVSIELAEQEIIEKVTSYNWDDEDFLVVVFHAGLGQDLGAPLFDPTVYDIHSAYIDENMLRNIGNSDITHNINFKLFQKIIDNLGGLNHNLTTQKNFLTRMGINERAEIISKNYSFKKKADMYYRLKRLIHQEQMGNLFKVMLIKNKKNRFNLGF